MNQFVSRPLDDTLSLDNFSCGNDILDGWLQHEARRAQHAGVARVTVWAPADTPNRVVAFYCVSPTQIVTQQTILPRSASAGYSIVPAWLMGRLAVDTGYQGIGIGTQLMVDAVETVVSLATRGGGRLILVDPIDDATDSWYRRLGFAPFTPPAATRQSRLFMRIDRALDSLATAQPLN